MNSRPLHFTLRELSSLLGAPRLWLAFGLVVLLFAMTGPFGTYDGMRLPGRLAYWLGTQAVCWLIALTSISVCAAVADQPIQRNVRIVVIGAAVAAPIIAVFIEFNLWALFDLPLTWAGLGIQVLYTLPLSLMFGGLAFLMMSPGLVSEEALGQGPIKNRLIERLPIQKRGKLLYLSMQDHYVDVVTDKGSELVLLRLGDAIAEIPEGMGLQIHRSHWVALDAVQAARRDGSKMILTMVDGTELPVSRSYAKAVREAGIT